MKITIELTGTLELAALESALEMFEAWAQGVAKDGYTTKREEMEAKAGIALLKRIRGAK